MPQAGISSFLFSEDLKTSFTTKLTMLVIKIIPHSWELRKREVIGVLNIGRWGGVIEMLKREVKGMRKGSLNQGVEEMGN